jgi:hypothetical protein
MQKDTFTGLDGIGLQQTKRIGSDRGKCRLRRSTCCHLPRNPKLATILRALIVVMTLHNEKKKKPISGLQQ